MSGLNIWTRAILRIANRIAGERSSEWCAAMAAETDAAGPQGMGWALGCVSAALKMRLRSDWKWIALLFALPLFAHYLRGFWIYPITWALTAEWIGPMGWAIALQLPMMVVMALVAYFARNGLPVAFILYAMAVEIFLPGIEFALKFDTSPFLFLSPEANWLNLPRNQGMALLGALLLGSVVIGRIWRRVWLRDT